MGIFLAAWAVPFFLGPTAIVMGSLGSVEGIGGCEGEDLEVEGGAGSLGCDVCVKEAAGRVSALIWASMRANRGSCWDDDM